MNVDQVRFKLEKVYKRWGIIFKQAKAIAIHPEGDEKVNLGYVDIEYTAPDKKGQTEKVEYDFLVNATGPKLNFEATEGLGPGKNSVSVCSYDHAAHAWSELEKSINLMKDGKKQRFLIGTGHAHGNMPRCSIH